MNHRTVAAGLVLGVALLVGDAQSALGPDTPAHKPQVWAVLIGVDLYGDPGIPRCPGAIRDGVALARWFNETARWGSQHLLLMNENGDPKHGRPEEPVRALLPTRENLDWALKQWLGHRLQPGDVAVVYFAGRSAVVDDREWLLPIDARADDLDHSGWTPEGAVDELALKKQATVVVWLDTALLGSDRPESQSEADSAADVDLLNRLTRWPNVTAWLAHRPQAAGPGLGPFLSALAKGLGARPNNMLACLDQMHQDPALQAHGFRVRGGVSPLLTLWPEDLLPQNKLKPSLLLQQGHADAVTAVVLSADGELMITASQDSTIRIWRVRDRERILLRVISSHTNGVTALALSPNGRFLASGDGMGQLRVWDLAEMRAKPQEAPSPHQHRITSLAFLPDKSGGRFVALDQDGLGTLWNAGGPYLKKEPFLTIELVRLAVAGQEGPVALALADPDGKLILFGSDGKPRKSMRGTGGRLTSLHFAPDGRMLAAGDEEGRVRVWDVETGATVFQHDYAEKIGAIRLGPTGGLAVGAGDRMYLAALDAQGPGLVLEGVGDELDSALFSGDGRWLAALTTNGNRHLWAVSDRDHPQARALPIEGRSPGATCLAFDREARRLVAGEGDGGIRSWDLSDRRERPRIPPHRGKVEDLSVSADGRFLLQITRDGQALIWDLKEGRGARTLPGRWSSGTFLPNQTQLAMTRDANHGGDVVLIDRESGRARPVLFERPPRQGGREPSQVAFERVAVARDGRKVAAAAAAGQVEIVCIWDIQGGPPRVLRGHTRTITGLAFAGDGRSMLTASEDGTAKLWNLPPDGPGPVADPGPPLTFPTTKGQAITAAQFNPANPWQVVTAHWGPGQFGEVVLWDCQPGRPLRRRQMGELLGRPHVVVFTPDGRWAGAAGQDKAIHLWSLQEGRAPERVEFDPEHRHTEQVKALTSWTSLVEAHAPIIASGGDDTTVRLWTLDPKSRRGTLLGTLVAVPVAPDEEVAPDRFVDSPTRADWLAFTPDGVYDSSLEGDRMVSFVLDREVRPLEQYAEQFHKFQLTDDFRLGARPQAPTITPPPSLVIDPPPNPNLAKRDIELRISLADPSLNVEELRLYQNGVPVQDGRDFRPLDARGHYAARVHLRSRENTFYAMAGRRGDIDARSRDVTLFYDGDDSEGRLHVLALGVKDYSRNALRFASLDAEQLAEHLHRNGIEGVDQPGAKIVLTDGDVTGRSVEDAFATIRREVKGRPEDVVVVFMAGHTDVLRDPSGRERFSLLLSSFPFPQDAPLLAANRGVGIGGGRGELLPPGVDLPFAVIYRNMSRLDALQRLIIIDACQAEAIYNDPEVRRLQRVLETETHRARTSYLLAARRGEAANESAILEHGLLTYVLLRGMQAPGLRPLPMRLEPFEEIPNADRDGDGYVTSQELQEYADRTLPVLANRLPDLAQRSGPTAPTATPEPLRIQASEGAGFRLVTLPRDARRAQ